MLIIKEFAVAVVFIRICSNIKIVTISQFQSIDFTSLKTVLFQIYISSGSKLHFINMNGIGNCCFLIGFTRS